MWRLENAALAFIAPRVGLVPAYPALMLAAWALLRRRTLPTVPLALAAGGVAYTLVAVGMTRVSGGSGFWGNRTVIESVVMTWPLLAVLLSQHRGGRVWRAMLTGSVCWSVAFHALGALTPSPAPGPTTRDLYDSSTVMFWQVPAGLQEADPWHLIVLVLLVVAAARATWSLTSPPPPEGIHVDQRDGSTSASDEQRARQ